MLIGESVSSTSRASATWKALFPDCVEKIIIRDVTGAKVNDPKRLPDEIQVIHAPLVTREVAVPYRMGLPEYCRRSGYLFLQLSTPSGGSGRSGRKRNDGRTRR